MSGGNIKVVVRCRPLNSRELARGAKELIRMDGSQTILDPPENIGPTSSKATEKKTMNFSFDKSYWSAGPKDDPKFASQQTLYDDLGVDLLDHSFEGFNTCIFAYGQTGSGKSYSMMGYGADKGIIPLTTLELFRRVEERSALDINLSYTVEVSYIEIYNEKVRDLLNPKNKGNLRVREHPSLGPYVEDLSRLVVENDSQMMTLMDEGNKARTVASTNMNETSSRSHAVFTVILTQKRHDAVTNMTGEKVSKISLVDLAGSERQASTGATGTRLKEGANINRSLTTLGKVIAALATASETAKGKKKKDDFVPYRDSVLTWLLKESLGGNSKTAMIAAISPADYEETLSTLRYADAAKKIKTHAVVNEDPNAKLIRELKEELDMLRSRVASSGSIDEASYDPSIPPEKQIVTYRTKNGEIRKVTKLELQDQLQASEKLMEGLNLTWEEKMAKTQAIHVEREQALEELGIMVDKHMVGVHAPQKHPSLVNLNEDPLMSECLVYQLKPGATTAGGVDDVTAHIKLSGTNILPEHCVFNNRDGIVMIEAMPDARTFVNGKRIPPRAPVKLLNGFRVILGDFHVFRYNDPASVRAHREKLRGSTSMNDIGMADGSPGLRPDSPARGDETMDWTAARREVADIEKLGDQDLDKLFDDIVKVRTQRNRTSSRMDLAAEFESRFMTASQTEESLDNPWGQLAPGTTMTTNSIGTPANLELDKDSQPAVDEASETGTEPLSARLNDQKTIDSAFEQQHLTKQLRSLAQELKRTRSQAAAARALDSAVPEDADWTARERRLVSEAVERWKRLRTYKLAEAIFMGAVDIREANVVAKSMGREVSYNFLVVVGDMVFATSNLDDANGVVEFEDVSRGYVASSGPVVVVKVVDKESKAVYEWDLARFHTQLNKMRHALALQAKPKHSQHFLTEGTFTEKPSPTYSFIGRARVPLRLLNYQQAYSLILPIQCQYAMEAIGSCRISFQCAKSPTSGVATPDSTVGLPLGDHLVVGDRLTLTIVVDTVKGLSSGDFASVHAQTRLSSLVGSGITTEDTFTSQPIHLDQTSVAHLLLRRTVSVVITPDIIAHFAEGRASIEFFAKVQPEYLDRLERFDRSKEVSPAPSGRSTPLRSLGETERPAMRRCETDFVAPEQHDILAMMSIKELASDGTFQPADVIDNVVHLHQGVQRQVHLTLTHSSGKGLPWVKMEHLCSSDIRVVAKGTMISVSRPEVELRNVNQQVTYHPDGTSTMSTSGSWDTAAHQCMHLDRRTTSDSKIVVRFTWLVEISSLDSPAVFHLDLPIRILGRDARRTSLLALFSAPKIFKSLTAAFHIDLAPPLASSPSDLWRLDTGKKHVSGEELLGDHWKPRKLGLIEDYRGFSRRDRLMGEVQMTKVVLSLSAPLPHEIDGRRREEVMAWCVEMWRREVSQRIQIDLKKRSEEEETALKRLRAAVPDLAPKLVPSVQQVTRTEHIVKQGSLSILCDPHTDNWEKRHFVLRRPYLHVHPAAADGETQIINLSKATVNPSPDVEALLGRRFAFTIFTKTNSHVLQAGSAKEMNEWIGVIATTRDV